MSEQRGGARPPVDRERYPYRMKDLCKETGLDRQTIHFYIQQGLVPEGYKTGRNMAYYGPEHLGRLRLVRRLRREQFLPLRAIRAVVEGEEGDGFTPQQQRLIADVKRRLAPALGDAARRELVEVEPLLRAHGVRPRELKALERLGLLTVVRGGAGPRIPRTDVWLLEFWGGMRALGVLDDLSLSVADLAIHEEAVARMFEREQQLLLARLLELPSARAAELIERALPLINTFIARYHQALVRDFLAALG